MAGAQALDLREYAFGKGTEAARAAVRKVVAFLEEDRPLFPDHNAMAAAVAEGKILRAVEEAVGPLDTSWH